MTMRPRLVGALLGSLAAFGVAGAGFAAAQETPTTTAPPAAETPSTTQAPDNAPDSSTPGRSDHCDHDGGTGQGTDGTSDTPTGATTSLFL